MNGTVTVIALLLRIPFAFPKLLRKSNLRKFGRIPDYLREKTLETCRLASVQKGFLFDLTQA